MSIYKILDSLSYSKMIKNKSSYCNLAILKKGIFFLFSIFLLSACQNENFDLNGIVGTKAPTFTLTTIAGNQVNLFDFNNKVVVLYFFGNGCPYCISEGMTIEDSLVTPYLNRTDYVVLGLDFWNGSIENVKLFQQSTDTSFPLLLNAGNVASNYKTTYNRIVIIDKNKNVIYSGTQSVIKDLSAIRQKLDILLKN